MSRKVIAEYTGKDIMDKLEIIHKDISDVKTGQAITNGRVKRNIKMIYASFGFTFAVLGWLVLHLIQSL